MNESGVDTRKSERCQRRMVFALGKHGYVYKRQSMSGIEKSHVKIDNKLSLTKGMTNRYSNMI